MFSKFLFMELFALFKLFEVIYELRESNLMEIKFGPFWFYQRKSYLP